MEHQVVTWTMFLRVKDDVKAGKLIERVREILGVELRVRELEPHWKDEALYRCVFTTPVGPDRERDIVWGVLQLAGKLAPTWEVGGLIAVEEFWGWASTHLVLSGVDSTGFAVGSSAPEPPEYRGVALYGDLLQLEAAAEVALQLDHAAKRAKTGEVLLSSECGQHTRVVA